METRTALILLLCLVSAAMLVAGCTTQTSGPVTTVPATMTPVTTGTSITVMTTGTPDISMTTGTVSIPGTSIQTTTSGTPSVSLTDDKTDKVRIRARNFAFDVSRITVPAGSLVTVEFENEDNAFIMWLPPQLRRWLRPFIRAG